MILEVPIPGEDPGVERLFPSLEGNQPHCRERGFVARTCSLIVGWALKDSVGGCIGHLTEKKNGNGLSLPPPNLALLSCDSLLFAMNTGRKKSMKKTTGPEKGKTLPSWQRAEFPELVFLET